MVEKKIKILLYEVFFYVDEIYCMELANKHGFDNNKLHYLYENCKRDSYIIKKDDLKFLNEIWDIYKDADIVNHPYTFGVKKLLLKAINDLKEYNKNDNNNK